MKHIKKDLEAAQIILVEISSEQYMDKVLQMAKALTEFGKVLYVTVNRPYTAITELLKKQKLPLEKFFFIDAVTKSAGLRVEEKQVKFVPSPSALTEMSVSIFAVLEKQQFYSMLFDSLSTLLIYENSLMITKFVHNLSSKFRMIKTKAIFLISKGGMSESLVKDLTMFVDKVVKV